MAGPRNPGGPGTGPPDDHGASAPYGSGDEESTAVDPDASSPGRWEEKTVAEKGVGGNPLTQRGPDEITAAGGEDSGQFLVDTGVTQNESASASHKRRIASGTGETGSNIEPLTVEESAVKREGRPRVPSGVQFTNRAPSSLAQVPEPCKLVVIAGSDRGREFALTANVATVGRGVENDIILTDISVSRKHMRIEREGDVFFLVDLESGNGTLVNDEETEGRRRLINGDRLELGNTVLRVDYPEPAGAADDEFDEDARTVAGRLPPQPPPGQLPLTSPTAIGAGPGREPSRLVMPATPPGASAEDDGDHASSPYVAIGPPRSQAPMPLRSDTPSVIHTFGVQPIQSTPQMPVYPMAPAGFIQGPTQSPVARSGLQLDVLHARPLHHRRNLIIGLSAGAIALYAVLIALSALLDNPSEKTSKSKMTTQPAPVPAPVPAPEKPTKPPAPVELVVEVPEPSTPRPPTTLKALITNKAAKGHWGTDEDFIAALPPAASTDGEPEPPAEVKREPAHPEPGRKPEPDTASARAVDNARRKANQLYASKSFSQAASALRAAASAANKKDQRALRRDADSLDELARLLTAARKAEEENPPDSLSAYRRALSVDARLGGAHRDFIQERRASAAVSAAASYMARGELLKAKQAADVAEQAGLTGGKLALVRRSLERKAQAVYDDALELSRSAAPEDRSRAMTKAKEARSLVPSSSPVHEKASKLVTQLKG